MGKLKVCCSSPASLCYWFVVSAAAWAIFAVIGRFWHPLHGPWGATCLLAMAVGCFANALKNRTYHCMLTGPLFLIGGILLLSSNLTHVKPILIWPLLLSEPQQRFSWNGAMRGSYRPKLVILDGLTAALQRPASESRP